MSLFFKGDYKKAIRPIPKDLKMDASSGKNYNNMALALYKFGKYEETFEHLKEEETKPPLIITWAAFT